MFNPGWCWTWIRVWCWLWRGLGLSYWDGHQLFPGVLHPLLPEAYKPAESITSCWHLGNVFVHCVIPVTLWHFALTTCTITIYFWLSFATSIPLVKEKRFFFMPLGETVRKQLTGSIQPLFCKHKKDILKKLTEQQ